MERSISFSPVIPAKRLEKMPLKTDSCCAMYDFRYSADGPHGVTFEVVKDMLAAVAKHWAFQKEAGGESGYLHWQGRMSLRKKRRKAELVGGAWAAMTSAPLPQYLAPTSGGEAAADQTSSVYSYVTKADTRVAGPWKDTDVEVYVPRQYRGLLERMWPWQRAVWESADDFHDRRVNIVYCPAGCSGKSTIAALCALHGRGLIVPIVNDQDKLVAAIHGMCADRKLRAPSPVIIDLPRAMEKGRLYGIYSAIEQVKNGRLYDVRNHYAEWWIDSPAVWVFTNATPETEMLSADRWKVWAINAERELIAYVAPSSRK